MLYANFGFIISLNVKGNLNSFQLRERLQEEESEYLRLQEEESEYLTRTTRPHCLNIKGNLNSFQLRERLQEEESEYLTGTIEPHHHHQRLQHLVL